MRHIGEKMILLLCIAVFGIAAVKLIDIGKEYYDGQKEYKELKAYIKEVPVCQPEKMTGDEPEKETGKEIDFEGLRKINEDLVAWIQIPGIGVDYPVVQGEDNEYYLYHTFQKENNKAGEIYGLVGENGAGKTTLIRLLTGLNFKSEGEIILFGHNDNLQYERSKIGCTIEMPALYKDMTASQNLEVQRIQRGIPNKNCIADTLELIGLSNAGKKRVANFSLGMKQRLALGVALLGEPEFLILDEPVNGLDPTGIIELRGLLKKLVKERETTILISSHILSELHQLATCYGFLHKGELLKQISAQKLNEECKRHICLKTDNIQKTTLILEQKANIKNYSVYPDNSIRIYDCLDNVRMISKLLTDNEIIIDEISVQGEDLETYFENLIGGRKNV